VSWSPTVAANGVFVGGRQYAATITLMAKEGFTLQGVAANFFAVAGATSVSNAADSGVVTAVFPVTAIALDKVWLFVEASDPSPYNTLEDALRAIQNDTGEFIISIGTGSGIQYLNSDTGGMIFPDMDVTLTSHGGPAAVQLDSGGSLFEVNERATLTLEGSVTLEGIPDNSSALIVIDGGELHIKDNVVIRDNKNEGVSDDGKGGGIAVINNGKVYMSGGTISGNEADGDYLYSGYGGGVYVAEGTFIMSGGAISGNTAGTDSGATAGGGGVYVDKLGIFTMSGGEISGNNTTYPGGGVRVASGGLFTMEGGEIKGNGNITPAANGGGVYVNDDGTFNMHNGIISGNKSTNRGGGVFISNSGDFYKNGGIIYGSVDEQGNTVDADLSNQDGYNVANSIYHGPSHGDSNYTSGPNDTLYQ